MSDSVCSKLKVSSHMYLSQISKCAAITKPNVNMTENKMSIMCSDINVDDGWPIFNGCDRHEELGDSIHSL